MSVTFTKLFASITESTVWCESDRTRLAWITMLAMADSRGRVWASIPGLANRARIPVEDARIAIECFLSPDRDSRTSEHEGRRIEPIDGGWRLLNHEKYRKIRDEESVKASKRDYINGRRAAERDEAEAGGGVENVDLGRHNAEAEVDADTEKRKSIQKNCLSKADLKGIAARVLLHLNEVAGTGFHLVDTHMQLVIDRIVIDGATEQELCQVIDMKTAEWRGDQKTQNWLRPSTLFRKSNYANYVGLLGVRPAAKLGVTANEQANNDIAANWAAKK